MMPVAARLELFERWVAALRSGEYKQGSGWLRTVARGGSYWCCLGVLDDMIDPSKWDDSGPIARWCTHAAELRVIDAWAFFGDGKPLVTLVDPVSYLGVERATLSALNDDGMPFPEIADVIDNQFIAPLRGQMVCE